MRPRLPNSVLRLLAAPRGRSRDILLAAGAIALAALLAFIIVMPRDEFVTSDHPIVRAGHELVPVAYDDVPGWVDDDPAEAFAAFRRSCAALARQEAPADGFLDACSAANSTEPAQTRTFFEEHFAAYRISPRDGEGLLTAYYEPVIEGSRIRTDRFSVPLHTLPEGHVVLSERNRPKGFDATLTAARQTQEGLQPLPTRGQIEAGALDGIAEPLVWVEDPVDAFFIHIQGSTRIVLENGEMMRVGFAGRNGHPYTSVGGVMLARGIKPAGGLSMDGMRAFFRDEPEMGRELLHENRSYIFFREIEGLDPDLGPVGAQGVPLTTRRSIAIDPDFHHFGTPVFITAELPIGPERDRRPFRRLMIAQDTGSAIKGAARADLFWGTGPEAGSIAGGIKAPGEFYVLLPRRS